jgi:hypothetical protein
MSTSLQGEMLTIPVVSLFGIGEAQISFLAAVNLLHVRPCSRADCRRRCCIRGPVIMEVARKENMDMNPIGKFEMREILNEFDATLIACSA